MRARRAIQPPPPAVCFQVRGHALQVSCCNGRWEVSVDSLTLGEWFMSQVAAWEAGVREADRMDRVPGT